MDIYDQHRADLQNIYQEGISAVHPRQCIPRFLQWTEEGLTAGERFFPRASFNRIFVAGAGKAAAAMAAVTEDILGDHIHRGIIAVKEHHGLPLQYIEQVEGGHPTANTQSVEAAKHIMQMVQECNSDDILLLLWSGGASALVTDVPEGLTLEDISLTIQALSDSGASIHTINTMRKHLSCLKGGQLARLANGANIIVLVISDVTGNDLSVIGSGPVYPDPSTFADALTWIQKYHLEKTIPPAVIQYLEKGIHQNIPDTPKPGDKIFEKISHHIIADNHTALQAAALKAQSLGYETHIIRDDIHEEVEDAVREWMNTIRQYAPGKKTCLLAGGETTVRIRGKGKGGRNQHFALAAAMALREYPGISLLAAGTDGTDGPTDAAGAIVNTDTVSRSVASGADPAAFLADNDSYHFFKKTGELLITGPTQTNVMDMIITVM